MFYSFLIKGFPIFSNSLPETSLSTIAANIYQALKAQIIKMIAAKVSNSGKPKWTKSNYIKPTDKVEKVTVIALCINRDPTQKINVKRVKPIR